MEAGGGNSGLPLSREAKAHSRARWSVAKQSEQARVTTSPPVLKTAAAMKDRFISDQEAAAPAAACCHN